MSVSFASKNDLSNSNLSQGKSTWVRPSDWLAMPTVSPTENKVVILNPVFDTDNEIVKFQMSTSNATSYTVDWGDGIVESFTSNSLAQHTYTYANISASTISSRGYKQVLIVITPTNTGVYFNNSPIFSGNISNALDVIINYTNNGTLPLGGSSMRLPLCESINIINGIITTTNFIFGGAASLRYISPLTVNSTSLGYIFHNCSKLEYCPEIKLLQAINSLQSAFAGCSSLKYIPKFPVSSVTNLQSMFNGCSSLTYIPNFQFGSGVTTTNGMFSGCSGLKQIDATFASNSIITTTSGMYTNCYSLTKVPTLTVTGTTLTNTSSMYSNCYSVETFPLLNTSYATNTSSMHLSNFSMKEAPFYDLQRATNLSNMFATCTLLTTIPLYNIAAASGGVVNGVYALFSGSIAITIIPAIAIPATCTSYASTFPSNGFFLTQMRMTGLRYTFSLASNKLSAAELNIIYGNLVTTTGQTITVTGNPGTATDNPSIATAKGWSVVG
jgi:hypothetical protein